MRVANCHTCKEQCNSKVRPSPFSDLNIVASHYSNASLVHLHISTTYYPNILLLHYSPFSYFLVQLVRESTAIISIFHRLIFYTEYMFWSHLLGVSSWVLRKYLKNKKSQKLATPKGKLSMKFNFNSEENWMNFFYLNDAQDTSWSVADFIRCSSRYFFFWPVSDSNPSREHSANEDDYLALRTF